MYCRCIITYMYIWSLAELVRGKITSANRCVRRVRRGKWRDIERACIFVKYMCSQLAYVLSLAYVDFRL